MSARDSESGSSTYKGGSGSAGGLGNGGIGGGMGGGGNWGGGMGGGAARNGGIGNRTGLTTGNTWYGNTAFGRPGGRAYGYGMMRNGQMDLASMRNWHNKPFGVALASGPLGGRPTGVVPASATPQYPSWDDYPNVVTSYNMTSTPWPGQAVTPPAWELDGITGGHGVAPYNSFTDPSYQPLGSGQTSVNGRWGGQGYTGIPGPTARQY